MNRANVHVVVIVLVTFSTSESALSVFLISDVTHCSEESLTLPTGQQNELAGLMQLALESGHDSQSDEFGPLQVQHLELQGWQSIASLESKS
jgi:hypothetical protein